jgi:hypothetical protein
MSDDVRQDCEGVNRRTAATLALGLAVAGGAAPAAARVRPALLATDRLAIEDLFAAYVWSYDCSDLGEFLSLFTDDAVVVGRGRVFRGHDGLAQWFHYLLEMRDKEGDDTWMHEAGQFRFRPSPSSIVVFAYATHFSGNTTKATRGVRSLGYFACECVRESSRWKFRRFSINAWDKTTLPWKKPLPWSGI